MLVTLGRCIGADDVVADAMRDGVGDGAAGDSDDSAVEVADGLRMLVRTVVETNKATRTTV